MIDGDATGAAPAPKAEEEEEDAAAIAAAIDAVAVRVWGDMQLSGDLAQQQTMTRLGDLQKKAFPLARAGPEAGSTPVLAPELLPYTGSWESYRSQLLSWGDSYAPHSVAVVQAPGSGITRLAYVAGATQCLVIMIRVWTRGGGFTPAWRHFKAFADDWAAAMPALRDHDREHLHKAAVTALMLLAECYTQFVADVLRRVAALAATNGATIVKSCLADTAILREAALRCLGNDEGDAIVGRLYQRQLAAVMTTATWTTADGRHLCTGIITHATQQYASVSPALAALRDVCPGTPVLMWWDNADALLGTPGLFVPATGVGRVTRELRDWLNGLKRVCASLKRTHHCGQTLTGTNVDLATCTENPGLYMDVALEHHVTRIAVADMLAVLGEHLVLDDRTTDALRPHLAQLAGRPGFFYDGMLRPLWQQLQSAEAFDAVALRAVLCRAAAAAVETAKARLRGALEDCWTVDLARQDPRHRKGVLAAVLYARLHLDGGVVRLAGSLAEEAHTRGIVALPFDRLHPSIHTVNLHNEPALVSVLQEEGDRRVMASASASHPDADPVFIALADACEAASVYTGISSSYNALAHAAFTWHLLRSVRLHAEMHAHAAAAGDHPHPSLASVLQPLLAPGYEMPPRTEQEYVVASALVASSRGVSTALWLCEDGAVERVCAGHDHTTAFATAGTHGKAASAVIVGVHVLEHDMPFHRVSPAWQHVRSRRQREHLFATREAAEPSPERARFQALATADATAPLFSGAFRVVLSLRGFHERDVAVVNALNALDDHDGGSERSPIILCTPSSSAFGERLSHFLLQETIPRARLAAAGAVDLARVAVGGALAFLLPQTIGGVAAGVVDTRITGKRASALLGRTPAWRRRRHLLLAVRGRRAAAGAGTTGAA